MQNVRFADRFDGAVIVAQPVRVATVIRIDDVMALGRIFAVVIDNGEQTIEFLILSDFLGRNDFCDDKHNEKHTKKRFKKTLHIVMD